MLFGECEVSDATCALIEDERETGKKPRRVAKFKARGFVLKAYAASIVDNVQVGDAGKLTGQLRNGVRLGDKCEMPVWLTFEKNPEVEMVTPQERFEKLGAPTGGGQESAKSMEGQMFKATTRTRWKRWVILLLFVCGCAYYVISAPEDALAKYAKQEREQNAYLTESAPTSQPSSRVNAQQQASLVLQGIGTNEAIVAIDGTMYVLRLGDDFDGMRLVGLRPDGATFERLGTKRFYRLANVEGSRGFGGSSAGERRSRSAGQGGASGLVPSGS